MRSYFNGSGVSTPPPGSGLGPGRPHRPGLMSGRASSSSLPRSPDNDTSLLTSGLGTGSGSQLGSGSGQSGHGSLGSHSSHEVSYMNIYQNTNHPHLYVSRYWYWMRLLFIFVLRKNWDLNLSLFQDSNLDGSPRHSLGSNNSSNLSTPPSPAREIGSSSYES